MELSRGSLSVRFLGKEDPSKKGSDVYIIKKIAPKVTSLHCSIFDWAIFYRVMALADMK